MRSAAVLAAVLLLVAVTPAALSAQGGADAAEDERAARSVVKEWIDLIDSERYAESWEQAGDRFRNAVTADGWAEQVGRLRSQLGELQIRSFSGVQRATDPPDGPPGEYIVVSYASSFANMADASEHVVTMKQDDGSWRTVGYFIRPGGGGR